MSPTEVSTSIREFLRGRIPQNGSAGLSDDLALIEEGYLTSLDTVELVMFIEEQFQVEVEPEAVNEETFHSLATITAYIEEKLKGT